EAKAQAKALLVDAYEKETTDFFREPNDHIFSVSFSKCELRMEASTGTYQQGLRVMDVPLSAEGVEELKEMLRYRLIADIERQVYWIQRDTSAQPPYNGIGMVILMVVTLDDPIYLYWNHVMADSSYDDLPDHRFTCKDGDGVPRFLKAGQPSNPTLCYDIQYTTPSPIPVKGSNSLMEEIDFFLAPDDSIPPGIENDDYDRIGKGSFHFDRYYVPSSPRPPEKTPDDDDIYFDIEPDTRVFTKVVDDIFDNSTRELDVHVPNVLPTLPTLSPMFDNMLPFSSKMTTKYISDFSESPMMIYEGNIPILDVLFLHFYPP
ncbi:hypothetical protein Tco_0840090, partial [Tanacetum coccineum]